MYETAQDATGPVAYSLRQGEWAIQHISGEQRQQLGQFLTPPAIARFMASELGPLLATIHLLEPGGGAAILACAVIERAVVEKTCHNISVDCIDIDPVMCTAAERSLQFAIAYAKRYGIQVHARTIQRDFILDYCSSRNPDLFGHTPAETLTLRDAYDCIIANPPYFKLNSNDPRVRATANLVHGTTNMYTLFMAIATRLMSSHGQAAFLVPRSFCSGAYFGRFRRDFIRQAMPVSVHLFDSRSSAFSDDKVLQENVIVSFRKPSVTQKPNDTLVRPSVMISSSHGRHAIQPVRRRSIPQSIFAASRSGETFFRLPITDFDEEIIRLVDTWTGSLDTYQLNISTGPVVPFRAQSLLTNAAAVERNEAVPLLWMQHVRRQSITWPLHRTSKPQGILVHELSRSLLVPIQNSVLLRRFSAKEDTRRLTAAPLLAHLFADQWSSIGLENHLNYIYSHQRILAENEVHGLAALLNSALLDRYVRITNGTTQVNAAELRVLPLPSLDVICAIGDTCMQALSAEKQVDLDAIVFHTLIQASPSFADIPLFRETRITMGKIQEAQHILRELGLPKAQQNEMAALTLLVLAQVSEQDSWGDAKRRSLGIHEIMGEMALRYDRTYAENTRETIRRQVIHQFVQAGLVVRNPDEPTLPTNSPRTHYALADDTIRTIRTYGTDTWQDAVTSFALNKGALLELYQRQHDQHKIPLILENGEEYHLSPGKHNQLQAAIIEEFGPRFAPGARLLYLGDTAQKTLILDRSGFEALNIPVPHHDKLPDVVLFDQARNWLFLIEAVTSHGPVSPKRRMELDEVMQGCLAGRVYVSAFLDFVTFKSYLTEIAWETEVWLAELPAHLIHFNGDRFLGPRD